MKLKRTIVIAVIIVIIFIAGYLIINNQSDINDETTIILSKSSYIKIPTDANATSNVDKNGVFHYKSEINITSSSNMSSSSSIDEMKKIKNSTIIKSKKIKENNTIIYEKEGIYSIFIKNTKYNDTLIIQSMDKNLLMHCFMSLKYHNPTDNLKISTLNTSDSSEIINVVEKTQQAVQKSTEDSSTTGYDWSYGDSSRSAQSSSKTYSTSRNVGGAASSAKFDFE